MELREGATPPVGLPSQDLGALDGLEAAWVFL
jgi:hypothetical protein